jgi:hypothetical protein
MTNTHLDGVGVIAVGTAGAVGAAVLLLHASWRRGAAGRRRA